MAALAPALHERSITQDITFALANLLQFFTQLVFGVGNVAYIIDGSDCVCFDVHGNFLSNGWPAEQNRGTPLIERKTYPACW